MVWRRKQTSFPFFSLDAVHPQGYELPAGNAICWGVSFFHSTLYFSPDHKVRSLSWAPATVWGLFSDAIDFRLVTVGWHSVYMASRLRAVQGTLALLSREAEAPQATLTRNIQDSSGQLVLQVCFLPSKPFLPLPQMWPLHTGPNLWIHAISLCSTASSLSRGTWMDQDVKGNFRAWYSWIPGTHTDVATWTLLRKAIS